MFAQNSTFYFNEIDCAPGNADVCCAAAEASSIGVEIWCTSDGTAWQQNFKLASV